MKTSSTASSDFTVVDLVVVVAIFGIASAVFVRGQADDRSASRAKRSACVLNLRQIGVSFRLWSNEHGDRFPMQHRADKAGSRDGIDREDPLLYFKVMTNEIINPKILSCPADNRPRASSFSNLALTNLSYFVGIDADETLPQTLLSGDRNVTNGIAPRKRLLELTEIPAAGWTEAIHNEAGNVGLGDGSVQQLSTTGLRRQIKRANDSNGINATVVQMPDSETTR